MWRNIKELYLKLINYFYLLFQTYFTHKIIIIFNFFSIFHEIPNIKQIFFLTFFLMLFGN